MKTILILTSLLFFLCSCYEKPEEKPDKSRQELEDAVNKNKDSIDRNTKYYIENTRISFGTPICLKSTENMAIPIILDEIYMDKEMNQYSYFNIAVVDSTNYMKKLLFDESVVIEDIKVFEDRKEYVYNEYSEEYSDGDERQYSGHYNSQVFFYIYKFKNRKTDYRRLFVYNLKTDKLTQLSPEKGNVQSWKAFNNHSKVLIYYKFDGNKDGKYDEKDDENLIMVDPNDFKKTAPLFDLVKLKDIKYKVARENKLKTEEEK